MKYILYLLLATIVVIDCDAQNVGIGTSSPSEKLHVAGNLRADTIKPTSIKMAGDAGEGKVLTSDAAGNATWRTTAGAAPGGSIGYGIWGDCSTSSLMGEFQPVFDDTGGEGDLFGEDVSISGEYAIVGASFDNNVASYQGSATILRFNGTKWVATQKLSDPAGVAFDVFGSSVSISGNFAAVGAYNNVAGGQGSVVIYRLNGSTWTQMTKITPANTSVQHFGFSVAIDGNYLAVGCPKKTVGTTTQQGMVYTYRFDGTNWVLMTTLTDASGVSGDQFGYTVAIDGDYLAAAAPYADVIAGGTGRGTVLTYRRSGTSWISMQRFSGATDNDLFGYSLSIAADVLAIGVPQDDQGVNSNQGAVNVYLRNGTTWTLRQRVFAAEGEASDWFGNSVATNGNEMLVGIRLRDVNGHVNQGAASLFTRTGNSFVETKLFVDPLGKTEDFFGGTLDLDDSKRFVIGASQTFSGGGKATFGRLY